MAPEIAMPLNQGYTSAVDCWSLGIVLHGLVLGFLPYKFKDTDEICKFARGAPPAVELFGCVNRPALLVCLVCDSKVQ